MNFRIKSFNLILNAIRYNSSQSRNVPIVKVLCSNEDNYIKVSFKLPRSPYLSVKASKEEIVQNVLSRIKLIVNLQRKKEEIRQVVMNKLSNNIQVALEEIDEDFDVNLVQNDIFLNEKTTNIEAWTRATQLKIGDLIYDVKFNFPTVISLTLPEHILSGCYIRPRFRLENANFEDCNFVWYRSQPQEKFKELLNSHDSDKLLVEDKIWLKVSEGFIYESCSDDIGCFLKVICTPWRDDYVGQDYSIVSGSKVQALPENLPFVERQRYTESLTEGDSIRCVSYNTLANTYVERRKFPYCSEKARDNYYRKQLLLKELVGYNSDIICLQEIEERLFTYDMLPILKKFDLDGCYKKKGGRRYEGLASFYRTSKFKLIDNHGVLLNEVIYKDFCKDLRTKLSGSNKDISVLLKQDSAVQILVLELLESPSSTLVVANTHLYSNKDSPEVRLIQAAVCTQYIEHLIETKNLKSAAVLFCGDFNSLPSSDTYDFMTNGKCSQSSKNNSNLNDEAPSLIHNLNLHSACGTPDYTNYTEEFNGCLDYIFYSKNNLKVSEVVPMPKHDDVIAQTGLPNENFPSDHIALVCTLKWKDV